MPSDTLFSMLYAEGFAGQLQRLAPVGQSKSQRPQVEKMTAKTYSFFGFPVDDPTGIRSSLSVSFLPVKALRARLLSICFITIHGR